MSKCFASHSWAKVHVLALANTEQSAGYSFKTKISNPVKFIDF